MIVVTICKLLLGMGLGYYLNRKGIFSQDVCQKLSWFIVNITMPMLIITSLGEVKVTDREEMILFILVGAGIYAVLPFLAKLLNLLSRVPKEERPAYEMFYLFSNCLFMGYPVAASLYGAKSIFYLNLFNLGFDLLYYTYGIGCSSGWKNGFKSVETLKMMANPGSAACLAAIILFFCDLQLPSAFNEVCNYVGNVSSPLSMIIIGAGIGNYSLKSVFAESRQLYVVSILRLIVMPVIAYGIMTLTGFTGMLRGIAVVTMGMPVAAIVSMGCTEYGIYERQGSAGVAMTTVLSMGTIPLLLLFLS